MTRRLLVLCIVLAASCNGPVGATGDASAGSGLIGTWGNTTCAAFCTDPDCGGPCDNATTFGATGTWSTLLTTVNRPSNTSYPGCTITVVISGYTYTATATTFTVAVATGANASFTRSGCMRTTDNQGATLDPTFNTASVAGGPVPYTISGTALTIGSVVMTRR